MAYDPAELRLPPWLLRFLDALIRLRLPVGRNWRLGLTRPGIMFMAAVLGVWAAAMYSGNNLLYLCGAMLISIMLVAIAQAIRLLHGFPDPVDALPPILQAGESSVLHQGIDLDTDMAAVVELSWFNDCGRFNLLARCAAVASRLRGRLQPERRGLFDYQQVKLSTSAPLGLFILQVDRNFSGEMIVLPQPMAWASSAAIDGCGNNARNFFREGDEWRDLRQYVPGDPLSRVHWRKATGDVRTWSVKRFSTTEQLQPQALLRVDLRLPSGKNEEDFDRLLGRVWFWIMEQRQTRAKLILGQNAFNLSNERQYMDALKALAGASPEVKPAASSGGLLLRIN